MANFQSPVQLCLWTSLRDLNLVLFNDLILVSTVLVIEFYLQRRQKTRWKLRNVSNCWQGFDGSNIFKMR